MARFGAAEATVSESKTTLEALAQLEEINKKKQERAARFGIETKEMAAQKLKERQERFGIETKESIEAKRQERLKRFANGMDQATQHAASSMDADEVEARRAARLIRFGEA